jgi:molybdopterin converting factor small subunit
MQINVTIKFFGPLRRVTGTRTIEKTIPEKTSLGDLLLKMQEEYPGIQEHLETAVPLVNQKKNALDEILFDGDVITFVPQVSGG